MWDGLRAMTLRIFWGMLLVTFFIALDGLRGFVLARGDEPLRSAVPEQDDDGVEDRAELRRIHRILDARRRRRGA